MVFLISGEGAQQSENGSHAESKENKCNICSQVFTTENQLQRHLRDHEVNDKASGPHEFCHAVSINGLFALLL